MAGASGAGWSAATTIRGRLKNNTIMIKRMSPVMRKVFSGRHNNILLLFCLYLEYFYYYDYSNLCANYILIINSIG